MYLLLVLHIDSDDYLKYLLERIDLESSDDLTCLNKYSQEYPDHPILFNGKAYLAGQVISENHQLSRYDPTIQLDEAVVLTLPSHLNQRISSVEGKYYLRVYGNIYYLCQTDGKSFDINKMIWGYGSF